MSAVATPAFQPASAACNATLDTRPKTPATKTRRRPGLMFALTATIGRRPWPRAAPCAALFPLAAISSAPAAETTGAIEGRVFNPGTGEFLEKARITIEGTSLETFTDSLGHYEFTGLPAGTARVKVFYTGL